KTLLNLSPLLKLDGYYLLSDLLDTPNLRRRSFAYFGEVLRHPWRRARNDGLSPRQRRIYLTYGAIAWIGSMSILTVASITLGARRVYGHLGRRVAVPIRILPQHNADVRSESAGVIEEIDVEEGQLVSKGDLIAKLDDRQYRADLDKTTAQIRQDRAKLKQLKTGPTREQLELARQAVVAAEDKLRFATAKLKRSQELFQRQLVSNQDYDQAREAETA